ncbi:TraR/DksA family transcriptional regulator [Bogoriella caseilytica]|uniref:TraR/DksA family transcriptional regulator n=1 Tax=Bogoriella caseilytica TaxID=56055 RepID=A0A3N2BCL2_9MICO|nr:TraR/DksA C4-type zinc finger protein [Bogoriella caseilytica]ROR72986.1 TraR/DksA family transcriptional regulator [Bogoriella caseilytica]
MTEPVDIAELRRRLAVDRENTLERIASLDRNFAAVVEGSRLSSTDDEHDPEGATIAFERSQISALLASSRDHLVEVDRALQKIADGGYGSCERCGRSIAPARLLARPAARTCITCAAPRRA